jgi:hypothetical protein
VAGEIEPGTNKNVSFPAEVETCQAHAKIQNKEVFGNIFEAKLLFEKEMEML